VRDADYRARLAGIAVPVLVIAGSCDPVTTVADGEELAAGVADGRLVALEAAHLSNIGDRKGFNAALVDFLRN
jgi:3-oxoadipate enol-lactonase